MRKRVGRKNVKKEEEKDEGYINENVLKKDKQKKNGCNACEKKMLGNIKK